MSDVRGKIAIDIEFADRTSEAGVQSLKTISLRDATEYTSGKVAIVTGTCGTTPFNIGYQPTEYRDASGELVNISPIRLAFAATPAALLVVEQSNGSGESPNSTFCASFGGRPVVLEQAIPSQVITTAGTASYTLVIYGT